MWTLWVAAAMAQGQPRIIEGTPEFGDCLQQAGCADRFYRFLGLSMAEQGFTFQNDPQLLSPTLSRRDGWTVGGLLTTFPFQPPRENLSGKEEQTSYSPVLPRIFGGYKGAGPGETIVGAGAFFLPPIPVGGASALIAGVETGMALPVGDKVRIGAELDLTYTRARAPIVASEEQYEARDDFDNPSNLDPATYEAVCLPDGCVDTFTVTNGGLRVVASVQAGPLVPYVKVGLNTVTERLRVQYDDTTWGLDGVQPVAHAGSLLLLGDHVDLALGAALGLRPATLAQEPDGGAGLYGKLQGSAAWSF